MDEFTTLPGVVDRHVHLGLVDRHLLAGTPVVSVHDLGWDPGQLREILDDPPAGVQVHVVGPFHTAPGGYPTGRSWAPQASVRAVRDTDDASTAVREATTGGACGIKITLHTDFPQLPGPTLRALVAAAHDHGLPALVHAEGAGTVEAAVAAGADVLVHAPWTGTIPDDVLAAGTRMTWLSTLSIHDERGRRTAIENIARFRALGGRVHYGTDMGNGPTPVGVNAEEIRLLGRAGLAGQDLLDAVCTGGVDLAAPLPRPTTAEELITWLRASHRASEEP